MVMHVVEPGCGALAHARAVVAMTAAARETRDQRRAQQALCVDHRLVGLRPHRAPECADFAPCRRPERRARQRRDATGMTLSTARCSRTSGAKASSTTQPMRASGRWRRASVTAGMWWITSPSEEVLMNRISDMESRERAARSKPNNRFFTEMRVGTGANPITDEAHDGPGHRRRRLHRQPHGLRAASRPASASSCSTICRPASTGRSPRACRWSSARPAIRRWSPSHQGARRRADHPFRRLDRGAGFGRRSARLLQEQHREFARADRVRRARAA